MPRPDMTQADADLLIDNRLARDLPAFLVIGTDEDQRTVSQKIDATSHDDAVAQVRACTSGRLHRLHIEQVLDAPRRLRLRSTTAVGLARHLADMAGYLRLAHSNGRQVLWIHVTDLEDGLLVARAGEVRRLRLEEKREARSQRSAVALVALAPSLPAAARDEFTAWFAQYRPGSNQPDYHLCSRVPPFSRIADRLMAEAIGPVVRAAWHDQPDQMPLAALALMDATPWPSCPSSTTLRDVLAQADTWLRGWPMRAEWAWSQIGDSDAVRLAGLQPDHWFAPMVPVIARRANPPVPAAAFGDQVALLAPSVQCLRAITSDIAGQVTMAIGATPRQAQMQAIASEIGQFAGEITAQAIIDVCVERLAGTTTMPAWATDPQDTPILVDRRARGWPAPDPANRIIYASSCPTWVQRRDAIVDAACNHPAYEYIGQRAPHGSAEDVREQVLELAVALSEPITPRILDSCVEILQSHGTL